MKKTGLLLIAAMAFCSTSCMITQPAYAPQPVIINNQPPIQYVQQQPVQYVEQAPVIVENTPPVVISTPPVTVYRNYRPTPPQPPVRRYRYRYR